MKRIKLYRNIVALGLLFVGYALHAQSYHKSRNETKTFKVEKRTEIFIENKYGNIQLVNWDKDSISFKIDLEVDAKKEAKATEILESIDFDFISSKQYVEAKTSFLNEGSFWTDVKDKASSIFSGDNNTQINYTVYLPNYLELHVENKYGNIIMDSHQGPVTVVLSNGDFKAWDLGETNLELQFGFANIKTIKSGRIDLNYHSELVLDNAVDLSVESRSSRIRIEKVDNLKLKSNRDKCYLEEVGILNATSSFSYLELENLEEFITANLHYGDIEIRNIGKAVNKMVLDTDNTDISLNRASNQNISMSVTYDEKAGLYYNDDLRNKATEKVEGEEKLVKTTGVLGKSNNTQSISLNATLRSGSIRINTK
ncbi:MAG: hypothetical protein KDC79_09475 [Cyclobacteriaceae bacterium]|nr:hypothetical protein [Cyclobacteriaceae bacterium]